MKVIMVCTGNICRSPMAEGILRKLCKDSGRNDIDIDSAGIENYHQGQSPDRRAIKIMQNHGYDIQRLRARQLNANDVNKSTNLIMVATDAHLKFAQNLKAQCSGNAEIVKMLAFHPEKTNHDLFDPYYGVEKDFETTFQQLYVALSYWLNQQ